MPRARRPRRPARLASHLVAAALLGGAAGGTLLLDLAAPRTAEAGKPKKAAARVGKKAHFDMLPTRLAAGVTGDAAAFALARIDAVTAKILATSGQVITALPGGAPDPATSAEKFRAFIGTQGLLGSYIVGIEISAATEALQDDAQGEKRLVVSIGVHMLGEHTAGKNIAFQSNGSATITQDVGVKMRDADRTDTWDGALEHAVDEAITSALEKLARPKASKQ